MPALADAADGCVVMPAIAAHELVSDADGDTTAPGARNFLAAVSEIQGTVASGVVSASDTASASDVVFTTVDDGEEGFEINGLRTLNVVPSSAEHEVSPLVIESTTPIDE